MVHVGVLVEVRLVRHPEGVRRAQEALVGPGFYDNRGFEFNVANAVNIRAMIKSSKTVRILGMLNYFGLLTDRGGSVDNLMATFTKMLGSVPNLIEHCKSVLVLISKMPQNILLVKFRNRISTNHPTFPPELLDQLCLSDPLQRPHEGSLTREELLAKVMTLDAIHTDSTEMFNTVLNAEDQTSLLVGKNTRSVHGAWGCLGGVSTVYRPCTKHLDALLFDHVTTFVEDAMGRHKWADVDGCLSALRQLKVINHRTVDNNFNNALACVRRYFDDVSGSLKEHCHETQFAAAREDLKVKRSCDSSPA